MIDEAQYPLAASGYAPGIARSREEIAAQEATLETLKNDLTESRLFYQRKEMFHGWIPAKHTNLPEHLLGEFIGRQKEIDEIRSELKEFKAVTLVKEERGLVYPITGEGGIGKTRLAMECGRRFLEEELFFNGVWFFDFARFEANASVERIQREIVRVLKVSVKQITVIDKETSKEEKQDEPLNVSLGDFFSGTEMLLIFDNCEHIKTSCAKVIGELVQYSAGLCILATSRERLASNDQVYLLGPLKLPECSLYNLSNDGFDAQYAKEIKEYSALQMFCSRVRMSGLKQYKKAGMYYQCPEKDALGSYPPLLPGKWRTAPNRTGSGTGLQAKSRRDCKGD